MAQHAPWLRIVVDGQDAYRPTEIDYALGFRPPPGFLATLPHLKLVFSLGAGVDGFLSDPAYPRHVPLVRFVDRTLSREMAQYVVLQTLLHHRQQRLFDAAQKQHNWRQAMPPRRTEDTRIGIFGLGEIGTMAGERLRDLDFPCRPDGVDAQIRRRHREFCRRGADGGVSRPQRHSGVPAAAHT